MARRPRSNSVENKMARALDSLAEFERFQDDLLPILKKAIDEGWTQEKIYSHPRIQAMVAAKNVQIALMEKDSGRAHAAVKDITDRTVGKPTEKLEVKGKLEKMSDAELDALLATQLAERTNADELN
jgi:hypothetical protein